MTEDKNVNLCILEGLWLEKAGSKGGSSRLFETGMDTEYPYSYRTEKNKISHKIKVKHTVP